MTVTTLESINFPAIEAGQPVPPQEVAALRELLLGSTDPRILVATATYRDWHEAQIAKERAIQAIKETVQTCTLDMSLDELATAAENLITYAEEILARVQAVKDIQDSYTQ